VSNVLNLTRRPLAGQVVHDLQMADTTEPSELHRAVTAAFEALKDPVFRYVAAIVSDDQSARDVTQEAFVRLYEHLLKGHRIAHVQAWIFRVAHNLAIDLVRKDGATAVHHPAGSDERALDVADPSPGAEDLLLSAESRSRLRHALGRLSGQERRCLDLRAEGLTYREIAEVLGIRHTSVAVFLARGLKKLTSTLHDTP
jgi:RNA polymerase sigma-70 factor (ECF subfamily)